MTDNRNEKMDPRAIARLARTYGGGMERWPKEQGAGVANDEGTVEVARELDAARRLDAALDRYAAPTPRADLIGAILAAGERQSRRRMRLRRLLIAAGLLGVGLAGGLTGAVAVTTIVPAPQIYGDETMTAFGKLPGDMDTVQETQ